MGKRCTHKLVRRVDTSWTTVTFQCVACQANGVKSLGPSNDDSPAVEIEIRAAELEETEHWEPRRITMHERFGIEDHGDDENSPTGEYATTPEFHAGFLSSEIESHEIREVRDATAWAWDISRPLAEQLAETAADDAAADAVEALRADPLYAKVMEANATGADMPDGHIHDAIIAQNPPTSPPSELADVLAACADCEVPFGCRDGRCLRGRESERMPMCAGVDAEPSGVVALRLDAISQIAHDKPDPDCDYAVVELLVGPEPEQGEELSIGPFTCTAPHDGECQLAAWDDGPMVCVVPLRAEPDCRDEDGPEVERIMAEMENA